MTLDDEADLFCADDDVLFFTADDDGLGSLEDDDAGGAVIEDFLFCVIFAEDCLLLAPDSVRGAPWLILFGFMEADFLPAPPNEGFFESMVSLALGQGWPNGTRLTDLTESHSRHTFFSRIEFVFTAKFESVLEG